jgi:hypothetical protein
MKKICIIAFTFIYLSSINAQPNLAFGINVAGSIAKKPSDAISTEKKPSILSYGLFLYPKYLFNVKKNSSFSLGIPFTISGAVLQGDANGNDLSLEIDVPITFDYNVGLGSSKDDDDGKTSGTFIGAGLSYTTYNTKYNYLVTNTVTRAKSILNIGPIIHAGVNFRSGNNRIYFFRGAYKMGLSNMKFNSFSITTGTNI